MNALLRISPVILVVILACKSRSSASYENAPALADIASSEVPAPPPSFKAEKDNAVAGEQTAANYNLEVAVTRKIIKDGNMEIRVKELDEGKKSVDTLVKKFHGYYSNESFSNMDDAKIYTLSIRIPSDRFENFIAAIEAGAGEVVYKNISSRDVTEEYIDLETRLANKKNYLNRYGELLKKAVSVKDILDIQEKTRVIEEEIESAQGRLNYLNKQVDYSTLSLQISKKNDYNRYSSNKGSFIDRLKMSLVRGWFGFVSFILFIIKIWPFWLIVAGLYVGIRKLWIKRKMKKMKS
jgi:hypothetical protein